MTMFRVVDDLIFILIEFDVWSCSGCCSIQLLYRLFVPVNIYFYGAIHPIPP